MEHDIRLAVDAVVFSYKDEVLHLLLIQPKYGVFKDLWALPGGFVRADEKLTDAVHRELKEETGVVVDYLEQLYTFGDKIDRDPRARVVSVAYFALVNPQGLVLKADTDAADTAWFPLDDLPALAYDHGVIVDAGLRRLRSKLIYQPIGFDLLSEEFPFSDLEHLYATILGEKLDRRNFRKKIMSFGILEETGSYYQKGSGRPAKLYRFDMKKYKALEEGGFHFEVKYA